MLGAGIESRAIDARRGLRARLAKNVDDALVGGGERRGLGQRFERLDGGEPVGQRRERRRPPRDQRFDLVGAAALLAQVAAQPLEDERLERLARILGAGDAAERIERGGDRIAQRKR